MLIKILNADITKIEVEAIVNAANTSLLGGSGVDGAIHKAGGKKILEECLKIRNRQGGCKVGHVVITTAGNLPSKYVIHTVGPKWNNGIGNEENILRQCYINSLNLALKRDIKTIAFPNISTGIFGFPKKLACKLAFESISQYKNLQSFEQIIFVCHDLENFKLYNQYKSIFF